MKLKSLLFLPIVFLALSITSCLNTQTTEEQYASWKAANELYFNSFKDSVGFDTLQIPENRGGGYLYYKVIKAGDKTAGSPLYNDSVYAYYKGKLYDGTVFDKNFSGSNPDFYAGDDSTAFTVNGVIKGWTESLVRMHSGDFWRVVIPWNLAYGSSGQSSINPYSTLVFDMKLVSFHTPKKL